MYAAPAPIPEKPKGAKVDQLDPQLAGLDVHAPSPITNSTTATLMVTMVALKRALSWMPPDRMAVITRAISSAGRLKPNSNPKMRGAPSRSVGPPQQVWRLRVHDFGDLFQERLRPGHQRIVRQGHFAGDGLLRHGEARPVIVRQPQRHLDVENVQQLDEVVAPSRGHRARAHGVLQGQVPTDDPGEKFAEGSVGVGVGAARQRNHGGELRVAQAGKGAAQPGEHERQHEARSGVVRPQTRQHEDPRADDGAHPQSGELKHPQSAFEAAFAHFPGFRREHVHGLADQ